MQSKGWIWQACLLLTVSFIFSTGLPLSPAFCQTETTPQEKAEPESEGADDNAPGESSDEGDPSDDAPKADGQQDSGDDEQQEDKGDKSDKSDDKKEDDSDDEKDGDSDDEEEADENGSKDLADAFLLKIDARTTSDLDKIVKLCESALNKGLDDNETEQANFLASESLLRFSEGMAQRTFATPRDRRWQIYRAQAMPRLRKAVEFDKSNVAAFILLAKFEAMDPQSKAAALKNIEKAIELSVDDRGQLSDALVIRARLKEDKEAKIADLNQALKHNPANLQAHELRAWALLDDKKVDEAMGDFEYWFDAQPKNFAARVIVAERLRGSGDLFDADLQEKVIGILDEAAEIDPKSGIPGTLKAQIFLQQEKLDEAIEAATEAIEVDKRRPNAFRIRAAALVEKGDLDAALADANKLMKLDLMEGYQLRSQLFIQKAEYAKAIEDIRAMSVANPNNEGLRQQLAALYNADLRPEESIKIYNRLLRDNLVPDEGEQPEAVRRVIMAKRIDLLNSRGDARLSSGEHAKAITDYEECLKLTDELIAWIPDDVDPKPTRDNGLLNNFAWLLATTPEKDLRDGKRAIKLATEAAEITDFEQAHILSTVAAAYAETGDFKAAIKWIKRGLKANKVAGAKEDAREESIQRQEKSLLDELKFYEEEKPWREQLDPEEEREKAKAEKESKEGSKSKEDKEGEGEKSEDAEKDKDAEKSSDDKDAEGETDSDDSDQKDKAKESSDEEE